MVELYDILSKQIRERMKYTGEPLPTREEELQSQVNCIIEFMNLIEEMFPDEFEEAYEEYKKRKGKLYEKMS